MHPIQRGVATLRGLLSPDRLECHWSDSYCCLVSNDGTALTDHFVQMLVKQGWKVVVLNFPEHSAPVTTALPDGVDCITLTAWGEAPLQQQLQMIHQRYGAIGAFIHLHPSDRTEAIARRLLKQVFLIAKLLKHSLNQAALQGRSWFVTVARLDGALGVRQTIHFNPIDSGLLGLTKTLNLEWPQVFCRALDIHPEIPPQQAAAILFDELFDPNRLVIDVAYDGQSRQTLVCQPEWIAAVQTNRHPTPDSVFLVSGGGRGITAKCVVNLAQALHCRFILLGRSPLMPEPNYAAGIEAERELKRRIMEHLIHQGERPTPATVQQQLKTVVQGREIRATLAQIEAVGGQAIYLSTDIGSDRQLSIKITEAEQILGIITGIIHGAGNLADKLIEYKTEQDFESVYTPKIEGLEALLDCIDSTHLQHLVLFASAAGFYGNVGQTDYAIANEILNRFAHRFKQQHPTCHVSAFNWGPWDGGMVTPELKEIFKQRQIDVIPVAVGTQMLVEELMWGDQQTVQILVGSSLATRLEPLDSDLTCYHIRRKLTLEANPLLQDHVIGAYAVLPTVFATTWMANTCEQLYPGYRFFKCLNLKVLKGIVFDQSLAREYVIDITELSKSSEQAEINLKVMIWSKLPTEKPRYHYCCEIQLLGKVPHPPICTTFDLTVDPTLSHLSPYQDQTLFHGSNFQGITQILNLTPEKLTMDCVLPPIAPDQWGQVPTQAMNAIAADIQFQCMLVWVKHFYKSGSLPLQCRMGEYFRPIPEGQSFYVSMSVQSSNATQLTADITSHDQDGMVYSRVFGAQVIISQQLNQLFFNAKASRAITSDQAEVISPY